MKKLVVISALILFSIGVFAQRGFGKWEGWEEFRAKKVTFMTEKLELTPEEAQVFWPHYNAFDKKRMDLHQKKRELEREVWENLDTYTEKEFEKAYQSLGDMEDEEHQIRKEYRKKFHDVLPVKKALSIEYIEHEFRSFMFREYRKKKDGEEDRNRH